MILDVLVEYLASYSLRLQLLLAYCIVISLYLRYVAQHTSPGGITRAALSAPIVLANLAAPALFSRNTEICTVLSICFIISWLANFKVIGLCIGRGSLTHKLDYVQFAAVLCMPITPQQITENPLAAAVGAAKAGFKPVPRVGSNARLGEDGGSGAQLILGFAIKVSLLGAVVAALVNYDLPVHVRNFVYVAGMYAFLSMLMDGPASLATSFIGLKIAPHFDKPYLTCSLTDFWSRRWNLTAGNTLRFLIYDPIMEQRLVKDREAFVHRTRFGRQIGIAASFVVSGIVHELIFRHAVGGADLRGLGWRWFVFFSLQGPLLALENEIRKWAKPRSIEVPKPVAILFTCSMLMWLGDSLFFYPAVESGLAERIVGSLSETYGGLYERLAPCLEETYKGVYNGIAARSEL